MRTYQHDTKPLDEVTNYYLRAMALAGWRLASFCVPSYFKQRTTIKFEAHLIWEREVQE